MEVYMSFIPSILSRSTDALQQMKRVVLNPRAANAATVALGGVAAYSLYSFSQDNDELFANRCTKMAVAVASSGVAAFIYYKSKQPLLPQCQAPLLPPPPQCQAPLLRPPSLPFPSLLPSSESPWYPCIKKRIERAALQVAFAQKILESYNAKKNASDSRCIIYMSKYDYEDPGLVEFVLMSLKDLVATHEIFIIMIDSKQKMIVKTRKLENELNGKMVTLVVFVAHGRPDAMHYGNMIGAKELLEIFYILKLNIHPKTRIIIGACNTGQILAKQLFSGITTTLGLEHIQIIAPLYEIRATFLFAINKNHIVLNDFDSNPGDYYYKNISINGDPSQPHPRIEGPDFLLHFPQIPHPCYDLPRPPLSPACDGDVLPCSSCLADNN